MTCHLNVLKKRAGGFLNPACPRPRCGRLGRAIFVAISLLLIMFAPVSAQELTEEALAEQFARVDDLQAEGRYDEAAVVLRDMIQKGAQNEALLRRVYPELVHTHLERDDNASAEEIAVEALTRFPDIRPDPNSIPPPVIQLFEDLRARTVGTLVVVTSPNECRIILDGKNMGLSPLWIEHVVAGDHAITASRDGYYDWSDSVRVEPGKPAGIPISLERIVPLDESTGFRTGVGVGLGFAAPNGNASDYSGTGLAVGGHGWVGIKIVPWIILRTDIQGLFLSEEAAKTYVFSDSSVSVEYETIVAKISPKLEFFRRYGRFEPYIGGGVGPYFVWTLTDFDERTPGDATRTSTQVKHKLVWGASGSLGVRVYVTSGFSFDFNTQYDYIPEVETVSADMSTVRYNLRSVTFLLGINVGRRPR